MAGQSDRAANAAGQEVVVTRTFDAPRALVFRAWTDPAHLARWWGPKGFTNPVCEWEARPGGRIRIHMTGPDGAVYPMSGTFHEVVEQEKLVYTSGALEDSTGRPAFEVRTTVTFAEDGGRTTVTVHNVVTHATGAATGAIAGMRAGWGQSLDKLADDLAGGAAEEKPFVISRTFDAPRDLVFKAWTETERLTRWFGPVGFTTVAAKNDPRPGGVFHYCMLAPNGSEMWGRWAYIAVAAPEQLVFVSSFSDAAGNIVRAPFSETWPLEVLSVVTFAEADGRTTVTMRGEPVNATAAERATFAGMGDSMTKGWTGTLDQLAEHLAKG